MMHKRAWWQRGVIYQIYPRSFLDTNGDGTGDLRGITAKLDYLKWLGVDILWISPIFLSPMVDFGYDVADYTQIDPLFGTMEDFDELLAAAHQRDLKILLDFVPNHTSDQHEWFKEARASRDNPKRDWYIWKDAKPDGSPPNNWMSYFGGAAWTFDEHSGQYYLHNFAPQQPELNWRNPEVENAIHNQMRFWLERGVDGFRVDVIDRIIKDEQFRDNPPHPNWKTGDDPTWRYRRVYSEQRPEVMAYFRRLRKLFDAYEDRVIIGETAYDAPLEKLATYYGDPIAETGHGDGIHMVFNFNLIEIQWHAEKIKAHVDLYEAMLPPYGAPNYVLGNHDQSRLASRLGVMQARVAAMMLLTLRGAPTIYYGDEIGMTNVEIPPDRVQDPQAKGTNGFNRDECRTPMQWDDLPNAGFSPEGVEPWLPVADDAGAVNVVTEQEYPQSMLSLYHQLLTMRHEIPALHSGDYVPLTAELGVFAYLRLIEDERYLIALNFTGAVRTLRFDDFDSGYILFSTLMDGYRKPDFSARLSVLDLRPDEGIIVRLD